MIISILTGLSQNINVVAICISLMANVFDFFSISFSEFEHGQLTILFIGLCAT